MFGLVLVSAITVLQAYVFWRVVSLREFESRRWRIVVLAVGGVMWGVFVAARLYGHAHSGRLAGAIDSIGMYWMAAMFLVAVAFLAVDVPTGFGTWLRPYQPKLRTAALGLGIGLFAFAVIQGRRPPVVETFAVEINGLDPALEGMTIVALSDLHIGAGTSLAWVSARVDQVMQQHPALIVLLGDVVEGHGDPDIRFAKVLSRLAAPLGVWGVVGNHESHSRAASNGGFQKAAGIRILDNQSERIAPGLMLAGMGNVDALHDETAIGTQVARTLSASGGDATILLSHAPVGLDSAARHGVSLMLSGHTHGGQIWPFSYLVGMRYRVIDGAIRVGKMTVIVCRGTGTWGPPMRLWKRGSILRVTLRRS